MPIDPTSPDAEKLRVARGLVSSTLGAYQNYYEAAKEDVGFYTGGAHQWADADLDTLKEQRRPALSFNMTRTTVDHAVGSLADGMKSARFAAVARDDRFLADILNDLHDRLRREISVGDIEMEVLKDAAIGGIAAIAVDANEDPEQEDYVRVTLTPLSHTEFKIDPSFRLPDASDAGYYFRERWFSESEFKSTYPDFADQFDELFAIQHDEAMPGSKSVTNPDGEDYRDVLDDTRWVRRQAREVLVVHMEYITSRRVRRARLVEDPEAPPELLDAEGIEALNEDPDLRAAFKLDDQWFTKHERRWIEFIGTQILYDDDQPMPLRGWSLVPLVWDRDRTDKSFKGLVRDLKDPQREINKRRSQEIHLLNNAAQPGTDVEMDATPHDEAEFQRRTKTAGATRMFNSGALQSGAVRDRPMPPFPEGASRLSQQAIDLFLRVGNSQQDTLREPRGIPEAAATTQLKHRQASMAQIPVLRHVESFQKTLASRLAEVIVGLFPAQQIADMLSHSARFRVTREGESITVTDVQNAEAPPVQITSVRSLRYNVELESTSDSETSSNLFQMQLLMDLRASGVFIPEEEFTELLPLTRERKDSIRQAQAQMRQLELAKQAAEMELSQSQLAQLTKADQDKNIVEMIKARESQRHNIAAETTAAIKIGFEHQRGMADIMQQASAEDLALVQTILQLIGQRQQAREASTNGSGQG